MLSPELFEFAVILVVAGAAAGFIAGLFGVGGGIITVPVLFSIFKLMHVPPEIAIHVAVGTSLVTIIPTSIMSMRAHNRRGAVDKDILRQWGPAIVGGSVLGGITALWISGAALSLIFGVFAVFIAALMGLSPPSLRTAKLPPRGLFQTALAGAIGFISALVGVGGGSMSVPTMVLCNVPIHRAIGTAAAIGLFISLPAAIIFMATPAPAGALSPGSVGQVNFLAFALLAPASMLAAPQGSRLAHYLPAAKLRRIFSIFLLVIAVKMIAGVLGR